MTWRQAPNLAWHWFDGAAYVVSLADTTIVVLDGWSGRIWELLASGADQPAIVATLLDESDGLPDQVGSDVAVLLAGLEQHGLVEHSGGGVRNVASTVHEE